LKPVIVVTPSKSSIPVNLFIDDVTLPPPQSSAFLANDVDEDTLSVESGEIFLPP
jgi:hypothetical protein